MTKLSLLLIEDSLTMAKTIEAHFGDICTITHVRNTSVASLKIGQIHPDIVLSDYNLTLGTCARFLQGAVTKGHDPRTIIVYTGSSCCLEIRTKIRLISKEIAVFKKNPSGLKQLRSRICHDHLVGCA